MISELITNIFRVLIMCSEHLEIIKLSSFVSFPHLSSTPIVYLTRFLSENYQTQIDLVFRRFNFAVNGAS